VDSRIIP